MESNSNFLSLSLRWRSLGGCCAHESPWEALRTTRGDGGVADTAHTWDWRWGKDSRQSISRLLFFLAFCSKIKEKTVGGGMREKDITTSMSAYYPNHPFGDLQMSLQMNPRSAIFKRCFNLLHSAQYFCYLKSDLTHLHSGIKVLSPGDWFQSWGFHVPCLKMQHLYFYLHCLCHFN